MLGFEATRAIREREQTHGGRICIFAMTAHAMKGDRERCLEAGMDGQGSYADDLERFYLAQAKVPESPYTPPIVTADAGG